MGGGDELAPRGRRRRINVGRHYHYRQLQIRVRDWSKVDVFKIKVERTVM